MNIAIMIGISEYENASNLPGCSNDIEAMYRILNSTNKYDQVLKYDQYVNSSKLKESLVQLIKKYESKDIEEVFFYFSGHGYFYNNEFYYVLSNYEEDRINSTCLQNLELDTFVKNLKPQLFVKVIDACQSGSQYIKDVKPLDRYFKETMHEFERCYFLNSCLNSQSSFQNEQISDFTLAFIESLKIVDEESIRYKNIIDYISDKFKNNPVQNPLFVVQAKYIEQFCTNSDPFKEIVSTTLEQLKGDGLNSKTGRSLLDMVIEESKIYSTFEEGLDVLELIKMKCQTLALNNELSDLFDIDVVEILNHERITEEETVSEYLYNSETEYFAESRYTTEWVKNTKELPNHGINQFDWMTTVNFTPYKTGEFVNNYEGFDHTFKAPYKALTLNLVRKYQNIENFNCTITFFLNSTHIKILYFYEKYRSKNWTEFEHTDNISWYHMESEIKDAHKIENKIDKILTEFNQFVVKDLKLEFGLVEEKNRTVKENQEDENDAK